MRNKWLLALIFALLAIIYKQMIGWDPSTHYLPTTQGWFFLLSESSPLYLLLFVVGLMVVRREEIIGAFKGDGDRRLGLLFILPGAVLFAWGHYVNALDILFFSFLWVVMGVAGFLSGKRLILALLLPMLILALAIPPPAVLINQIVFPYQLWTSEHVAWLMNHAGISAFSQGDLIVFSDGQFRVAETCTALGFIKWLVIFTLANLYLYPVSRLHSILLLCISPFIAYGVNLLRVFSLVLSPGIEVLSMHTFQGVAFFLVAFVLLHLTSRFLARFTQNFSKAGTTRRYETHAGHENKWPASWPLMLCLTVLLFLSIALPHWSLPEPNTTARINLPMKIGDWKFVRENPKNVFLGTVQFTQLVKRSYMREGKTVLVTLGLDDRMNRHSSFMSPKNAYPDAVGISVERSTVDLGFNDLHVASVFSLFEGESALSYHWYENVNGTLNEIVRACLALDQSPFRRSDYGFVIRVDTGTLFTNEDRIQADAQLKDFISHMDMSKIISTTQK